MPTAGIWELPAALPLTLRSRMKVLAPEVTYKVWPSNATLSAGISPTGWPETEVFPGNGEILHPSKMRLDDAPELSLLAIGSQDDPALLKCIYSLTRVQFSGSSDNYNNYNYWKIDSNDFQ